MSGASRNELLVDLGAGTGLPGAWFPEVGFRYIGLDASRPMLELFAKRIEMAVEQVLQDSIELMKTDIDERWPVENSTVAVVFSSRAAHLFDREHLVSESLRVGRSGATVILGRVQREKSGLRRRLRDEMRAALRRRGYQSTDAGREHENILNAFCRQGATRLPSQVAAVWQARHSAADVISSWQLTSGLGGCELEPGIKAQILEELWQWAKDSVADVEQRVSSEERFTMEGVRLS